MNTTMHQTKEKFRNLSEDFIEHTKNIIPRLPMESEETCRRELADYERLSSSERRSVRKSMYAFERAAAYFGELTQAQLLSHEILWGDQVDQIYVHSVKDDVIRLISETDVESMPPLCPFIFRRPWIIESHSGQSLIGEAKLYGETVGIRCVAGVTIGERTYITYRMTNGNTSCFACYLGWGAKFSEILDIAKDLYGNESAVNSNAIRDLVSFVTTFALMLEASGNPMSIRDELRNKNSMPIKKGMEKPIKIITRYISLSPTEGKRGDNVVQRYSPADPLTSRAVLVRGHIRYQACGKGHADRKLIYVREHYSTRLSHDVPRKIVVKALWNKACSER